MWQICQTQETSYLALIRRLIKTYTLEPAGSHGVWGLDDHSFLPYLFGSAQYAPAISSTDDLPTEGAREGAPDPADVVKIMTVERERKTNMYFGGIGFIYDVKKGPFWEHSPMLFDISGVRAGWAKINKVRSFHSRYCVHRTKINQGIIKMYNAEVLSKFPVVQHFRFGSLFSWEPDPNAIPPPTSVHASSQPTKEDTTAPSINQISARAQPQPQAETKVPWATPAAALPNPSVGAAAPWASRPSEGARTVRGLPSRIPHSGLTPGPPAPFTPSRAPGPTNPTDPSPRSMPPPTRAPWAKPDT